MQTLLKRVTLIAALAGLTTACAGPVGPNTAGGALTGAGFGAIIGHAIQPAGGAGTGALAGAVLGGALGNSMDNAGYGYGPPPPRYRPWRRYDYGPPPGYYGNYGPPPSYYNNRW
ncbi:MAG: hypothetical protein U1F42_01285 [Candidatus Competibacteraceae bacterium]